MGSIIESYKTGDGYLKGVGDEGGLGRMEG